VPFTEEHRAAYGREGEAFVRGLAARVLARPSEFA
jgi:hypothetical protein